MADNTQINKKQTCGDFIATDDILGIKHQRVKVQYGGDGTAVDVNAFNGLPIEYLERDHDAFGRHRVSNPFDVFEVQHEYNTNPLIWADTPVGGATIAHLPNESSVRMRCGTASGDSAVRQSKRYFRYKPGKSQMIVMTANIGTKKANVRQRLGLFDANDGVLFRQDSSNLGVCVRSSTSGSVVDTIVNQSAWNVDTMDGNGPSGINIDTSKAQIFVMDLQWLGVGRVRFGFSIGGQIFYCHEVNHANVLSTVYMRTANLPLRYEIENTGTSASNTDLIQICASIASEGGVEISGFPFSVGNGITPVALTTRLAVLSVRLKSTFNGINNTGLVVPSSVELFTDTKPVYFEVIHGGTLGGAPAWNSVDGDSLLEFDVAGTTVTGGHAVETGYVPSAGTGTNKTGFAKELLSKIPLTNSDILTIAATSLSTGTNVFSSLSWTEIY